MSCPHNIDRVELGTLATEQPPPEIQARNPHQSNEGCIKFCCNNSDEVAASIKQWPAAVTGLYGSADLEITRVIAETCESTNITDCEIGCCGQKSGERISQCNDGITSAHWLPVPKGGDRE
jgi:hypothetical protein